jgi:beta-1,4-mannosyltransferase
MKILLACDCNQSAEANPYTVQLLLALAKNEAVSEVQHGPFWLWVSDVRFDVIHLQWPEALFNWREPTQADLDLLSAAFARWKQQNTRVVVTIHNEYPHGRDSEMFRRLYDLVYRGADGFIHLGEASIPILHRRHHEVVGAKPERAIAHGDYQWYPNEISAAEARRRLNLPADRSVVLVLGQLRSRDEIDLMMDGYKAAMLSNALLLVAGRLPGAPRYKLARYTVRIPFLRAGKSVRLDEGLIPAVRIQEYLNACDVLLIPRIHNINSGNVALGFTFGRTVVGPDIAVIGEQLRLTHNPVYQADSTADLGRALRDGVAQAAAGRGRANRQWAEDHMSWTHVGQQHVDFYSALGQSQRTRQPALSV